MGPGIFACKTLQKTGSCDGTGRFSADIGHIGEIRLQLFLIRVFYRETPHGIVELSCSSDQIVRQFVMRFIMSCEQTTVDVTECDDTGAGQRCDIDDDGRVEFFRIGQRITQDKTALGIGIQNFDRLS